MKRRGRWGSAAKQPPHRPDSARAPGLRARIVALPVYRRPTFPGRRFPMTARSWIRHLFARTIRKEPHACRGAPMRLRHEQLESRDCPAGIFLNDYSLDINNFFTPARRALVDFAEVQLSQFLNNDNLTAITPNPANGDTVTY